MNDLRKAAEMALERLESHEYWMDEEAIQALRQALAQPVDAVNITQDRVDETANGGHEWVGLTNEDIAELRRNGAHSISDKDFMAIEAKLREKNGGKPNYTTPTDVEDLMREVGRLTAACKDKDDLIRLLKEEVGFAERGYTKRYDL